MDASLTNAFRGTKPTKPKRPDDYRFIKLLDLVKHEPCSIHLFNNIWSWISCYEIFMDKHDQLITHQPASPYLPMTTQTSTIPVM